MPNRECYSSLQHAWWHWWSSYHHQNWPYSEVQCSPCSVYIMGEYFCRVNKKNNYCHFIFHFVFILILKMQFVKTNVEGDYSPMYVPSDMHSCLVPDRWTCRDVNEIFFADLEILSADKCLSLFQHWSSNRPIWDWGLQKGGSVVVSMARKKSLWSAELAQSSVLSITATHQELRTQDTLTSLLAAVVINLTIDRCHHRSATAMCEVWACMFAAPSHPLLSWL